MPGRGPLRQRLPLLLLAAKGASAAWLPIGEAPHVPHKSTQPHSSETWVHLEAHRAHPDEGYDPRCLGNVARARTLPSPRTARNHALVAPLDIGSPGQHLSCLLDAGSADIWLPARQCLTPCSPEEQQGYYNSRDSNSFKVVSVETRHGSALRELHIFYGGGSASGLVANETISLASATVRKQTFVLAEAATLNTRQPRSWDGVCGIGRHKTVHGEPAFHDRLDKALFAIAPTLSGSKRAARLAVGAGALDLIEPETTAWVPALTPDQRLGGLWAVNGTVSVGDSSGLFQPRLARMVLETGTSFMLVPPEHFLAFARTLVPDFDKLCGTAEGNVVVCSCEARKHATDDIDLQFVDVHGVAQRFLLHPEDLFEEVPSQDGEKLCLLQVQQKPKGGPEPGHLLGASALRSSPALGGEASSAGKGLPAVAIETGRRLASATVGLTLPADGVVPPDDASSLSWEPVQKTEGPQRERAVQLLGDGTHCVDEIVRAENGTVVSAATTAQGTRGGAPTKEQEKACADSLKTVLLGGPGKRLLADRDVWVLGDIFLRRYALLLDFNTQRVGFGRPKPLPPHGTPVPLAAKLARPAATEGAGVEAFVSGPASSAIQTYDPTALGGGLAIERLRNSAAHLLRDSFPEQARGAPPASPVAPVPEGVMHVRSSAADMMFGRETESMASEERMDVGGPSLGTALKGAVLGAASFSSVALGCFALRLSLLRRDSSDPARQLVAGDETGADEELGGMIE